MSTPRQVIATTAGAPDVLQVQPFEPSLPAAGQVRVRHHAIGVNFIDCYFRSGLYPWPGKIPLVPGSEAAGVVDAVAEGVTLFNPGDRVVYTLPNGAYATHRNIDATHLVRLPEAIGFDTAAAVMLKGLTCAYLLHDSHPVQAGQSVLFHAAAGGVGLLAGQWLRHKGAIAIGTAGGPAKCALAAEHGYAHTIDYIRESVPERVRELTGGDGVDAVYDSVGHATMAGSLASLRRHGRVVNFGQSSGPYLDFKISDLAAGSFHLTRPSLFHFTADREWLTRRSTELFGLIESGRVQVRINQRFALDEAAEAHRALEARQTTGCTVLMVDAPG